ncbi:MAG: 2-C-methyl-D-erythritol 4-phosphate cytidylyltransferase [Nostocoides sp.]
MPASARQRRPDEPTGGVALVVLAAGSSRRAETETNKILLPLKGRPVIGWTFQWTAELPDLVTTVVVCRPEDRAAIGRAIAEEFPDRMVEFAPGGSTRHGSEYAALRILRARIANGQIDTVAIHDSARPLASPRLFRDVIAAAQPDGGAVPAISQHTLVAERGVLPIGHLAAVQTPQAFGAKLLLAAYDQADKAGFDGTDTAACFEHYGDHPVRAVPGDPRNVKLTFPGDLFLLARILERSGGDLDR